MRFVPSFKTGDVLPDMSGPMEHSVSGHPQRPSGAKARFVLVAFCGG
jgi:hypothetical protein